MAIIRSLRNVNTWPLYNSGMLPREDENLCLPEEKRIKKFQTRIISHQYVVFNEFCKITRTLIYSVGHKK